jgi:hypothetical protein
MPSKSHKARAGPQQGSTAPIKAAQPSGPGPKRQRPTRAPSTGHRVPDHRLWTQQHRQQCTPLLRSKRVGAAHGTRKRLIALWHVGKFAAHPNTPEAKQHYEELTSQTIQFCQAKGCGHDKLCTHCIANLLGIRAGPRRSNDVVLQATGCGTTIPGAQST